MPTPKWSDLFGEWVLLAGENDVFTAPDPPPLSNERQLSLIEELPPRLVASSPGLAWVVYRKREWPLLRRLSEEERKAVHEIKRIFGGQVVEVT